MLFLNWHLVSALPCSSQATLASSSLKRRIKESLALRATAFAVVEADLQEAAVASGAVSSTLLPRWLQSLTCCAYISKLYPKVSFHLDSVEPNIFLWENYKIQLDSNTIWIQKDTVKNTINFESTLHPYYIIWNGICIIYGLIHKCIWVYPESIDF